ncbi:MAG TPA: disulfide oxidoreductase [Thermoanaerobaculia bacterium]|jgi:hybrid cluster-associated redox disulfide protein
MFQPDTAVADALAMHPKARWVFAAYHLSGCNGCERSPTETLQEVADGYRISLDSLLRDLNALVGADASRRA